MNTPWQEVGSANLVHKQLSSSIEPRCNGIVQRIFKTLLLSHDSIQKIRFVDMGCLEKPRAYVSHIGKRKR